MLIGWFGLDGRTRRKRREKTLDCSSHCLSNFFLTIARTCVCCVIGSKFRNVRKEDEEECGSQLMEIPTTASK